MVVTVKLIQSSQFNQFGQNKNGGGGFRYCRYGCGINDLKLYAIVAGWLLGSLLSSLFALIGLDAAAEWVNTFGTERNLVMMVIFMIMTVRVVKVALQTVSNVGRRV